MLLSRQLSKVLNHFCYRIPFFGIIKLLATLYLVLPAFNGATLVYIKVKLIIIFLTNLFYLIESAQVKPALSKYVDLFDKFVTSKIQVTAHISVSVLGKFLTDFSQAISASKPDATKKLESTKQQ